MTTGGVKNLAVIALVVGAVIFIGLSISGGSSGNSAAPVASRVSTVTVPVTAAPTTTVPVTTVPSTAPMAAGVSCPAGSVASSTDGSIPVAVSTGFMWTPAQYPSVGWCEVPG